LGLGLAVIARRQEIQMTYEPLDLAPLPATYTKPTAAPPRPRRPIVGYLAGIALVALAATVAYGVESLLPSPQLALVFVLPVLVAAITFGWGPALVAAVAAVLTFDFFFTQPFYSLRVDSPSDLWTMSLLLVVAAISSAVAAQSRRRALDAEAAAKRAEALHGLAHQVVDAAPVQTLCDAAGLALSQIFGAPAVVLLEHGDRLDPVSITPGAALSATDTEAARWALTNKIATRGENYPFDTATFDFWPIRRGAGQGIVLGVRLAADRLDRPADPERSIEMVGAYLAAGLAEGRTPSA
jgi:two-component system sensor histidine kinase KdpD